MGTVYRILIPLVLLSLSGCAPATLQKAENQGSTVLEARQIFAVVAGNTMKLSAPDFSATVYFNRNGTLAARDNENQTDTGAWDISSENKLCLKFRLWYYGDLRCYSLATGNVADRYLFFTSTGAAYYTGRSLQGDTAGLAGSAAKDVPRTFLRQSFVQQQSGDDSGTAVSGAPTAPSSATTAKPTRRQQVHSNGSIKRLASDCPGCNLSGADLKEARLINANLAGADLSGADLRYSNLRRADLSGANLSGAQLNHANLPGANLQGSNLRNADLSGANLLLADLTGADLSGAELAGAYLENTKGIDTSQ